MENKVPDAEKMEYVYDVRDLQIAMQNGNLRADGKWMVSERDDYGRTKLWGLNTTPTTVNEVWTESYYDGDNAAALALALGFTPANSLINPAIEIGKLTGTKTRVLNGNSLTGTEILQALNYNEYGQLISDLSGNHRGGRIWKYFDYDLADNLVRQKRIFHTVDIFAEKRDTINTTFDHQGRVKDNFHSLQNEQRQQLSQLEYTAKDELKAKYLGGTNGGFLQQINYEYLDNAFLKGINPSMSADDLFQLNINYDQQVAGLSGVGQMNGNISQLRWKVQGGTEQTYGYTYDFKDQLIAAKFGTYTGATLNISNEYSATYGYDARGNILSITREGMYNDGTNYAPQQIDNLALEFTAGSNKLKKVTDTAPCPNNKVIHRELDNTEFHAVGQTIEADNNVMETADVTYQAGTSITLKAGFHAKAGTDFLAKIGTCPQSGYETGGFTQRSTDTLKYDVNGNMVNDPNKGITNILFNYHNQPYKVIWANGNTIEWLRDGSGQKLQQLTKRNGTEIGKLDYLGGNFEYEKDTLARIYLEDAKLTFDKGTPSAYQYFFKDHLMSTRVVFENASGVASLVSEHHTYSFGLPFDGDFTTNTSVKRLYNFKERVGDFGLGWMDFGERYYLGGGIPRFLSVDPISEQFAHVSGFNYAENEPIANIDLWGLQQLNTTKDFFKLQLSGSINQGVFGAEIRAMGLKEGGSIKMAAENHASFEIRLGNQSGLTAEGQIFEDQDRTVGISGGEGLGGAIEISGHDGNTTTTVEANLGIGFYRNETEKNKEREITNTSESMGIQFGATGGTGFIGADINLSLEINLGGDQKMTKELKKLADDQTNLIQQDNTKANVIPLEELKEN